MAEVPGSIGWPLFSDNSLDFNSSPVEFLESNMNQYQSRVFAGRILNKATVFVCSNQGVREVLNDTTDAFELGYKMCLGNVYDDNVLFTEGEEASMLRDRLAQLFTPEAVESYEDTIQKISEKHVAKIKPRKPLNLYQFFKKVVTEITLTLFLGLDFSEAEEADNVVKLTLAHWHGILSVPVKLKIPGTCYESCYLRAMTAKEELMEVIQNQRGKAPEGFVRRLQEAASEEDDDFINNHMLLFSSALVPKAIASLLTTFAIEMGKPEREAMQAELLSDEELLNNIFREVQRICPPFLGGKRVSQKTVIIDGYKIPADYGVLYVTHAAHRDPTVFADPDSFCPERWMVGNGLSDDNLFLFGQGPRCCLGSQLVFNIIHVDTYFIKPSSQGKKSRKKSHRFHPKEDPEVVRQLLSHYHWTLCPQQDLTLKWLPVIRPKNPVLVNLVPLFPHDSGTSTLSGSPDSLDSPGSTASFDSDSD